MTAQTECFDVRIARTDAEIEAAQRLRYQVFFEEHDSIPSPEVAQSRRDTDAYDYCCDHLIVIDCLAEESQPFVVGTYRMMRKHAALSNGGFYSAQEFDLENLIRQPVEMVEVGRSCIHQDYRRGAMMTLLWRGMAAYLAENEIRMLFGCASFPGNNPQEISEALSYLNRNHLAPEEFRPRALDHRYVEMDRIDRGVDSNEGGYNEKDGLGQLPLLVKGYIRLGGYVGDGA